MATKKVSRASKKTKWRWPGWYNLSVRKPIAVATFIWCMLLCTLSFIFNRDIPQGAVTILSWIVPSCLLGYHASSAYETCHKKPEDQEQYSQYPQYPVIPTMPIIDDNERQIEDRKEAQIKNVQ